MPTKAIPVQDPLVTRLRVLGQQTPELGQAAEIYARILPLLRDADLHPTPIALSPEQALAKLQAGRALLDGEDLSLDFEAAGELMRQLACVLENMNETVRAGHFPLSWVRKPAVTAEADRAAATRPVAARQIRVALEQGAIRPELLLPNVAAGDREYAASLTAAHALDAGLVWILAQNALKPALRAWQEQLAPLAKPISWQKSTCWCCGSVATCAELQGNEQSQHVRCGQCGADWPVSRLRCVECGNDDPSTSSYLYPEGRREKYRIQVCDRCGSYLKIISSFEPMPLEMVTVEDLATLHLDYVAREHGYSRTPSRGKPSEGKA